LLFQKPTCFLENIFTCDQYQVAILKNTCTNRFKIIYIELLVFSVRVKHGWYVYSILLLFKPHVLSIIDCLHQWAVFFRFQNLLRRVKMETGLFGYWESFSKSYQNLGLNRNGNNYRKYENGIGRKIQDRKRKRFRSVPTVFGNYYFYLVF
jgi:hypothetical protein